MFPRISEMAISAPFGGSVSLAWVLTRGSVEYPVIMLWLVWARERAAFAAEGPFLSMRVGMTDRMCVCFAAVRHMCVRSAVGPGPISRR